MGAGKTRVGSAVAARLNRRHIDLDIVVSNRVGRSVGVIFAEAGEKAFRDLEQDALASELAHDEPIVVSTGGGVVERQANRQILIERTLVVWLRAEPETLALRVGDGAARPLLNEGNPLDLLTALAERRHPLYAAVSDRVIDTDHLNIEAVTALVEQAFDAARVSS
jgi:shikimate kinase